MNDRSLSDAQITTALRAYLPAQAAAGLQGRVAQAVAITTQRRPLPSFLGTLSDADPLRRRRSLLLAVALLLALALATAAAAGAWQLLQRNKIPQLDLTPPSDVAAFVLSSYDRMPDLPPMAITTLTDGSIKGRIYVDRSGAVRFEHYATPDALEPDRIEIFNGTTFGELESVGSVKVWVVEGGDGSTVTFEQGGATSEDPRAFVFAQMEGAGAGNLPGNLPSCGLTRNQGDVGDGTAASGWTYVGTEDVVGRPVFHVTCDAVDLWIDVQTRLILRSRGPAQNATDMPTDGQPLPGAFGQIETIEVTDLQFGEQPADLFAQPAGVAAMSIDEYRCQITPGGCPTPAPTQAWYTPPPGAVQGPLPSLAPSRVSNGWIAYSTDGQSPGSTDTATGSDIYLVREGSQPRLIASREGGTTRNSCPAFSPDGTKLAYVAVGPQGQDVVVLDLDANGDIRDTVHIPVTGAGVVVCPRWSSDGARVAYLEGRVVVVRGLDGSTSAPAAGDPSLKDFVQPDALLSPSGAWTVSLVSPLTTGCELAVAKPDRTATHIIPIPPSDCPYAVAAWSPDGRQVLLMQDVGGGFAINAIGVDSALAVTIVTNVMTDGARSWPGWGDVSWQPVLP